MTSPLSLHVKKACSYFHTMEKELFSIRSAHWNREHRLLHLEVQTPEGTYPLEVPFFSSNPIHEEKEFQLPTILPIEEEFLGISIEKARNITIILRVESYLKPHLRVVFCRRSPKKAFFYEPRGKDIPSDHLIKKLLDLFHKNKPKQFT
ncbi:MAG: hypothetical protein WCP39_08260 [Chlamydiota bacterium]